MQADAGTASGGPHAARQRRPPVRQRPLHRVCPAVRCRLLERVAGSLLALRCGVTANSAAVGAAAAAPPHLTLGVWLAWGGACSADARQSVALHTAGKHGSEGGRSGGTGCAGVYDGPSVRPSMSSARLSGWLHVGTGRGTRTALSKCFIRGSVLLALARKHGELVRGCRLRGVARRDPGAQWPALYDVQAIQDDACLDEAADLRSTSRRQLVDLLG